MVIRAMRAFIRLVAARAAEQTGLVLNRRPGSVRFNRFRVGPRFQAALALVWNFPSRKPRIDAAGTRGWSHSRWKDYNELIVR